MENVSLIPPVPSDLDLSENESIKNNPQYICVADGGARRFYDDIHHRFGIHL